MRELVLSLFPGVDLLGRGFEAEGFCVVRGPDLLWDQRIEEFSCASLRRHAVAIEESRTPQRGHDREPGTPWLGHSQAGHEGFLDESHSLHLRTGTPAESRLAESRLHVGARLAGPVRRSEVTRGPFDGIIAGPPCQNFSDANRQRDTAEGDRLLRETLRIIDEAHPEWFLIENVRNVPDVALEGYTVQRFDLTDDECGGRQRRLRHIQFGSLAGDILRPRRTEQRRSVTGRKAARAVLCRLHNEHDRHSRRAANQGVPQLRLASLTKTARARAIGNGVPFAVACTLAAAVRERGPATPRDCHCGCGRSINAGIARSATASCRKRLERRRRTPRRVVSLH